MKLDLGGNWLAKLICIIIAVFLWLFIMNDQNPLVEGEYNLDVEVQNLDTSLVALNVPDSVYVRLRMQRNTMLHLRESEMKAVIDLEDVDAGDYDNVALKLIIPDDAEILQQSPRNFDLRVDRLVFKTVRLMTNIQGIAPEGRSPNIAQVIPESVTVSGPSSIMDEVATVTADIDIRGRNDNFEIIAPVILRDEIGNVLDGLTVVPGQVQVIVHMDKDKLTRELPLFVPVEGKPAEGYSVRSVLTTPSHVRLTGDTDVLEDSLEWKLNPVSVADADRDIVTQALVPVPQGGEAEPAVVEVHIRITADEEEN